MTTVNFVNVKTSLIYTPALNIVGIPSSIILNGNSRLRTNH
ncbi:hypothetical protein GRAN_1322 [Granulicella sibirica]|uniref:Uncharacterized protein n=1 Tax=Granulicella sibirica TaxID=2479048 RepID=A0A4Q0T4W7_9BACT|nr:hypothetical protein GRAN_1322 [Granulicella sibirica]